MTLYCLHQSKAQRKKVATQSVEENSIYSEFQIKNFIAWPTIQTIFLDWAKIESNQEKF